MKDFRNQLIVGNAIELMEQMDESSVDLIIADPPYALGKDFGNDSDLMGSEEFLNWTFKWIDTAIPLLKETGSFYIFCTWKFSPEIFLHVKKNMVMLNEIIWDRKVPSMGGSTRKFSSVHDNIGLFVKNPSKHVFDLDAVRIPYDEETKKARSRSIFEGKKWLELGYNPKDIWSISRLHRIHSERVNHPTQKPLELIERMVLASSPPDGLVLDPFVGSGTTAVAAARHGRDFIGFDLNPDYIGLAEKRLEGVVSPLLNVGPTD